MRRKYSGRSLEDTFSEALKTVGDSSGRVEEHNGFTLSCGACI